MSFSQLFRQLELGAAGDLALWAQIGLRLDALVGEAHSFTTRLPAAAANKSSLALFAIGAELDVFFAARGEFNFASRFANLLRNNAGLFAIPAQINDARVAMVLDTGACKVMLTHDHAKAVGLPLEVLNYTVCIDTANGRVLAAPVTVDRIAIGSLVVRSVEALVSQPRRLKIGTSILGMSFFDRLQSFKIRGDRVVLDGQSVEFFRLG
jgi:aspartyl protease family protein